MLAATFEIVFNVSKNVLEYCLMLAAKLDIDLCQFYSV